MFHNMSGENQYDIVLLRHAESVGNANGYWQGQTDFPLTEAGRTQAQSLANYWQKTGYVFDQVISSPLQRARQTAEIICSTIGTEINFDANWMERDNGQLAGLTHAEATRRFPDPPLTHPYMPIGGTGESQWELYLRAGRAIQDLLYRPPGKYLVVSHGGILNMALYVILGIPVQANFQGPRFDFWNTAYATLNYYPDQHKWRLKSLNERQHLQQGEISS
jgi:2,3-bisphosphoglycerate-dependent phosphoglycerate mutase